jgi:hypothetical protein
VAVGVSNGALSVACGVGRSDGVGDVIGLLVAVGVSNGALSVACGVGRYGGGIGMVLPPSSAAT